MATNTQGPAEYNRQRHLLPETDDLFIAPRPQGFFTSPKDISLSQLEVINRAMGEWFDELGLVVATTKPEHAKDPEIAIKAALLSQRLHGMANIMSTLARHWYYFRSLGCAEQIFRTYWPTASIKWVRHMAELLEKASTSSSTMREMYASWVSGHHLSGSVKSQRILTSLLEDKYVVSAEELALKNWGHFMRSFPAESSKLPLMLDEHYSTWLNEVGVRLKLVSRGETVLTIRCRLDNVLIHQPNRHRGKAPAEGSKVYAINYKLNPEKYHKGELDAFEWLQILLEVWAAEAVRKQFMNMSFVSPDQLGRPLYAKVDIDKFRESDSQMIISRPAPDGTFEQLDDIMPGFDARLVTPNKQRQHSAWQKLHQVIQLLHNPVYGPYLYGQMSANSDHGLMLPRFVVDGQIAEDYAQDLFPES